MQAGTSAPNPKTRGGVYANNGTTNVVTWYGDPDGEGADDEFATRLTAKNISFKTGGTATFKLGGAIDVNTTQVSRTTIGGLMTYTLPAGTLAQTGQLAFVTAFGTKTGTLGAFTTEARLGGAAIKLFTSLSTHEVRWIIKSFIVRTGATTQAAGSYFKQSRDDMASTLLCGFSSVLNQTLANALAIDINLNGNVAPDTISQEIMLTKLLN